MSEFKTGHLKLSAPSKYRRLYESALRAHEAAEAHRAVIKEVGPDPITGRWHSQACWAGGLRHGSADMSGEMCWCGLQYKPEPPPEMRAELIELLRLEHEATIGRFRQGPVEDAERAALEVEVQARAIAFLNKWGVDVR